MLISSKRSRSFGKASASRGFTLIELLVVVAVITIITAVILFNQSKFDSSTLLRSLGYSMALSIREAQLYGTSVRYATTTASTNFSPSYGIYFDQGDLTSSPPQYYVFADNNSDTMYTQGEGLPAYLLPKNYEVSKVCGVFSDGQDCWTPGGGNITSLTVYFRRPNPDACIETSLYFGACNGGLARPYTSAYVEVQGTGGGDFRAVKITTTGQLTVCPLNEDWTTTPAC